MDVTVVFGALAAVWIAASVAVGWAAGVRGRPAGRWTGLALLLSPLFAILLLIAAGPATEAERALANKEHGIAPGMLDLRWLAPFLWAAIILGTVRWVLAI